MSALRANFDRLIEELGPEHPDVLAARFAWATELGVDGEYSEDEALFRDILQLRRRVLGLEHPDTVETERSLASICQETFWYSLAATAFGVAVYLATRIGGR